MASMFKMVKVSAVLLVAYLAARASAITRTPSEDALAACRALAIKYPDQLAYNGLSLDVEKNEDYVSATQRYWSAANAGNLPACVFLPESANEVSYAVGVLNNYTSVGWAVKGGGHNPNVGFSSTDGGVLISFNNFAATTLDSENVAHVEAGARWGEAMSALEPFGRAIVGGRLGDVGVAGYTLGGGLSFLSAQYGFASDNVLNFEVVLPSGSIVNANSTSNPDLFYALKGGGNQFGIITVYSFRSYAIDQVWGGTKIYTIDQKAALLSAVHNLTSDYHDPKAAVIVTADYTLQNLVDIFVVFFFYNSPTGPGAILDEFAAIPAVIEDVKVQSYADLLNANSALSLTGMRYLIRAGTLPNLPGADGLDLYTYQLDSYMAAAAQNQLETPLENFIFSTAFQPLPHQISQASQDLGGNRMNLDPRHGDRMWMEYDVSWLLNTTDAKAAEYLVEMTQPVLEYSRAKYEGRKPTHWDEDNGADSEVTNYNPLFLNDAMYDQKTLQSFGEETYQRLKVIQKQVDPQGLFSNRTGGFKYV